MATDPLPAWHIRPLDPDRDAAICDRLGQVIVDAYGRIPGGVHAPEYEAKLRDVRGRAATSCVLVALATADDRLLGGVTYVSGPDDPLAELLVPGDAGMRMLAVEPSLEGRGVGASLVRACLDRARGDRRHRLVLHTTPWMTRAHRLYERLGFRRAPELDWLPIPEVPLMGYVFDLD